MWGGIVCSFFGYIYESLVLKVSHLKEWGLMYPKYETMGFFYILSPKMFYFLDMPACRYKTDAKSLNSEVQIQEFDDIVKKTLMPNSTISYHCKTRKSHNLTSAHYRKKLDDYKQ